MRERPILFSGPMVRAILDGRKTQTRRVATQFHANACRVAVARESGLWCSWEKCYADAPPTPLDYDIRCPYGSPGDRLWVRETWGPLEGGFCYRADERPNARPDGGLWRPSIFMPRWASRLTLEVQAVRVERLQEITNADALAEGAMEWAAQQETPVRDATCSDARFVFQQGWDSLNAKRGFGWDANPWVWVVSFLRVEAQHGR